MKKTAVLAAALVAVAAVVTAQTPSPAQPPQAAVVAPPQGGAVDPMAPPLEAQGFTYDPAGRPDPFVNLVRRGLDAQRSLTSDRPAGLAGLTLAEVALKGTVHSGDGYVALLQGADNRTYIVRAGDKLFDGAVQAVSQDAMVVLQDVSDPLSQETRREVRKALRESEDR